MNTFYEVFGFMMAMCAGIVILALFFTGLSYFRRAVREFDVVKWKGFIQDGKLINVHLGAGKSLLGVRLVGFSRSGPKDGVPYHLSSMIVLENAKGLRVMIPANSVRMIEEVDEVA